MVSDFFTDTAVVVVVLGLMIFVHELGHFLAAKFFGVRVLTFSFGFGKRLFGIRRGDTDYRVSLLPLGGYVKMAGDDPSQPRQGDPREYLAKPRWQRFVIVIMGPAMNVLMALVLLTGLNRYHFQKPAFEEQPARVGAVEPDSPAAQAGILPGDLVVRMDGISNPKWEDLEPKVLTSAGEAFPVEVVRNGQVLNLSITPKAVGRDQVGYVGLLPVQPAVIEMVEPAMPAGRAGLQPGDRILAIDGKPVSHPATFSQALQAGNGREVDLTVARKDKEFHVRLKPAYSDAKTGNMWRVGVLFWRLPIEEMVVRQLPWGQAIETSVDFCLRNSLLTFEVLGKILTRRMSTRSLSGPIGISQIAGEAYREGWSSLVAVVSIISLQLGIFNLLPIPILDGGVILLLLIEGAIRRDLSLEVKERVVQVGFVFLLLLAVFVMYNDIVKTFKPY